MKTPSSSVLFISYLRKSKLFPCFHKIVITRLEVLEITTLRVSTAVEFFQTLTSVTITLWKLGKVFPWGMVNGFSTNKRALSIVYFII